MKILMTSIFVDNLIRAHEFYTRVLGFKSKEFLKEAQIAAVVSAEDPDGTALLLEPQGDSFGKTFRENVYTAGLPAIVFGTQNIISERERLEERGVKFRDNLANPEWGLENLFEDSYGNLTMVWEIPHSKE